MSNSLQYKMYNYEATPPAGVWEKIAEALDESDSDFNYPARLQQLEIAVPAAVWNKIQITLDAEQEKAIPEQRRLSPLIRYAAAAVVTGLLGLGAWQLFKEKNEKPGTITTETIKSGPSTPEKNIISPTENQIITVAPADTDEARNDAALEASKKTYARHDVSSHSKIKNAADFYFAVNDQPAGSTRGIDFGEPDHEPGEDLANRYVLLLTPDGNIVRMSKKLGEQLVCCVSGQEQDEQCIDQMKKWRNKLITSPASHSSGGFINILSLVNSLQDNNYH